MNKKNIESKEYEGNYSISNADYLKKQEIDFAFETARLGRKIQSPTDEAGFVFAVKIVKAFTWKNLSGNTQTTVDELYKGLDKELALIDASEAYNMGRDQAKQDKEVKTSMLVLETILREKPNAF